VTSTPTSNGAAEPRFLLMLELTEDQQYLIQSLLWEIGTAAWEHTMGSELDPESYPRSTAAEQDLADVEAILAQFPGGTLRRWRESLSESDDDEGDDGV